MEGFEYLALEIGKKTFRKAPPNEKPIIMGRLSKLDMNGLEEWLISKLYSDEPAVVERVARIVEEKKIKKAVPALIDFLDRRPVPDTVAPIFV